jgi:hypothetical protein
MTALAIDHPCSHKIHYFRDAELTGKTAKWGDFPFADFLVPMPDWISP